VWAEEVIRKRLAAGGWGDVGFLGEEGGRQGGSGAGAQIYWTIDPIDGTSHFVRGNEFCTTMLALVDHGVPVVGVIHDFIRGNTYTAVAGQGAYRNQTQRLSVSMRPMHTAQLELYTDEASADGRRLRELVERTGATLLRTAASGFTFLGVARGATEGFVTFRDPHCSEWDIAPGCLLVHEAGGIVRNVGGDGFHSRNPDYIAANPAVYAAVRGIIDELAAGTTVG
jgi:myo-inositol-1(or 4)-monophosphatase